MHSNGCYTLKIVVIGFYYGKFPDWLPYWLRSCADNPTIDFLLITDIAINDLPENVRKISMTLSQVKELCQQKLNMEISLEYPYKLCDYKPVYGLVLENYIQGYDYWGHCDFDLIWGDIRSFVNEHEIERYDKFLPLGHLSLYRNTEKCNHYYCLEGSRCGDYKAVFTSNSSFAFDETSGIYSIYERNGLPMFAMRIFAEIKTYHKRFRLKACDYNYRHQVFYYEKGNIYRAYEEKGKIITEQFIYIHFRRKLPADSALDWRKIDAFYITPDGFVPKAEGVPTLDEIECYNHNPGQFAEGLETLKFCFKNITKIKLKIKNEMIAIKGKRK